MAVVQIEITRRQAYAEGREFGAYGGYERIDGKLHYAVDPLDPSNAGIVDIELAPREGGMVHFNGDFTLIKPSEKQPRCLLLEVPNRGNRISFRMFNQARLQDVAEDPCSPGDGFLFENGLALLSVGWQFDAPGMKLDVPEACEDGKRLQGEVVCQVQPSQASDSIFVGQLGPASYRPTQGKSAFAALYEREHTHAEHQLWSREDWGFGRLVEGGIDERPDHVWARTGFQAGRFYTLVYRTEGAPVVGLGLLALRDAAACFRSDQYPGGSAPPPHVVAFGASQTGRVLRHMLYEGLYRSETGETAIDGMLPHIAGAQRGDFNHRFAQPSSMGVPACGQLFPFAGATTTDSLTGNRDGLYRDRSNLPKVFITNTSWEYWRGDAALAHVSTDGLTDVQQSPNERLYLFAGTHHINAIVPLTDQFALTGERVRYTMNTVSYTPLIRCALMNLVNWIEGNAAPPVSKVPRVATGSLVSRDTVIRKFAESGRFEHLPDPEVLTGLSTLQLGDQADQGICKFPAKQGQRYPSMVCNVDDSLNESAGIRLPDVAVPLGVHTGWNPRGPDQGAPTQAATFVGLTRFEKSLVGTYRKSDYQRKSRRVIDELIDRRFVLSEDRALLAKSAAIRFSMAKRFAE